MFKKWLLRALKSLTTEEKIMVRGFLEDETTENLEETLETENKEDVESIEERKSDTGEIIKEGEPKMSNENEKTTQKVDEVDKTIEKTENNEVGKENSTEDKVDEIKKEEIVDETAKTDEIPTEQDETAQVQEIEPQGNGARVEDLVTKDELAERLSALDAKFDAVIKENEDLKNQLSGMKDKYENKDFGNFQRQGIMPKDKSANSSFDEYSKNFM